MRILPAVTLALALSALSFAEEATDIPPPPPPPPSGDLSADLSAPPAPPPVAPVDHSNEGRVRWGVNGQLGWFVPQPMFTFGIEGRVGWSFNKVVAAYMSLGFGGGLYVGYNGRSFNAAGMHNWFVGAMGEINVGELFFVALGPALGEFGFGGVNLSSSSSGTQVQALAGITPSVDIRLGFGFGKRNPETGRRGGFTLALDLRAFFPTNTAFVSYGSNGQRITTYGIGYGLAPMLMLGFDSR